MDPPDTPATRTHRSRRGILATVGWFVAELAVGAGLVAALIALSTTEPGLRAGLALLQRLAPFAIEFDGVSGALNDGFGIDRLRFVGGRATVEIERLRVRVGAVALRTPGLEFESVRAERVRVVIAPSTAPTAEPPQTLALPIALRVARLAVGRFELHNGAAALALAAIDGSVAFGPDGWRVDHGRLDAAGMPVTLDAKLAAASPFALDARGTIGAAVAEKPVQARWQASGQLLDIDLAADLTGGGARGHAVARVAALADPPLKSLDVDVRGIVPRAWNAAWPVATVDLRAALKPELGATPGSAGSAGIGDITLAGSVDVVNHDPGTIDAGRVPLREASARIRLSRSALHVDTLRALLRRGAASGSASLRWDGAPSWQAQLQFDAVDPAAIHAAARSLSIDGRASLGHDRGTTRIDADLHHRRAPAVDARVALRVDEHRLQIDTADLRLGAGRLTLRGAVALTADKRVALDGVVESFAPGLLVEGVEAQINAELHVDARLAPQPQGRMHFEVRDSQAFGRPLSGRGDMHWSAAHELDVDVALAVRSARLLAQGGLGAPQRRLSLSLDVPALDELLPGVRGRLAVDATAQGRWDAPAVDARVLAQDLQAGTQRLRSARAQLAFSGGADGRITAHAEVADHRFGDRAALSLREASLSAEGPLSWHRLALNATTAQGRRVSIGAEGGLTDGRWRGSLHDLRFDGPLAVQLAAPAPVTAGAAEFRLGPFAIDAAGARFDAVRVDLAGARLRTEGRFTGLRPQPLFASVLDRALSQPAAGTDPLALRGEWQLAFGAQADGRVVIERSGGDLPAGRSGAHPIGLRELRLEATLEAGRLDALARASSDRAGFADLRLAAFVEHDASAGWRLAPQRPWQIDAKAELASLALVQSAFADAIGQALRIDGRLAAALRIEGTAAAMRSSGTLTGDDLRLAWIEQGTRLEQGTLRAHLADDAIVVDRLRFAATPRGKPRDPRVAGAIDAAAAGTVEASGRIGLLEAAGDVRVVAKRLPVLQRPDRWVVASGEAHLVAARTGARLDGEIGIDAGYVEASRGAVPTLSADVVVRRPGAAAAERLPRYPFAFDLDIDLGPAFRVKAAGLDARAEGALRLRGNSRGGGGVASGTIQTAEGRYEGFGQRLAIRRGRLNFQGAVDNPALDILAVREGLPVEVGVTVTRQVANPLLRLYADPPMADPEILSWLLYGHAGEQTRSDNLALLQAAVGVLGGSDEGITNRLARSLGLDDFTLRTGELNSAGSLLPHSAVAGDLRGDRSATPGAATGIVSIGKRIGDAVTISYEQTVSGTESVVQLAYRLSQRLYFVARAGTTHAFELVYSWAFD